VILIHDYSARLAAGPSSASLSSYYPQANYPSVNEVPLTARIDGEVQDPPPNVHAVFSFTVTSVVSLYAVI
jgi:hypothetical protein